MEFFRLSLRASLYYQKEYFDPFEAGADSSVERLFCYALPPAEATRIDPNQAAYPGSLTASGRAIADYGVDNSGLLELSAGLYYFAQIRKTLSNREELIDMAVELQKEGLWERLKLEETLYLRLLYEDGSPVSQLWRRIVPSPQNNHFFMGQSETLKKTSVFRGITFLPYNEYQRCRHC